MNKLKKPLFEIDLKVWSWKTVVITFIFGGAVLLFMLKLKREKEESIRRQRKLAVGKMAIGGPFELIDHNGNPCSSKDLLGNWLFVYFGSLKFSIEGSLK